MAEAKPVDDWVGRAWEALAAVPEGSTGEWIRGQVVASPRPDPAHAIAAGGVFGSLQPPFGWGRGGGPGGWVIVAEPRVRFVDEIRVPDVAGWRVERYAQPAHGPYLVVPDWVCEILSPSTALTDRTEKLPLFAKSGVSHAWVIDPVARTLEVLRRQGELWLVVASHGGDVRTKAEPFDAIELDLAVLWSPTATSP